MADRRMLEVPSEKYDPKVIRRLKILALHWGVRQSDIVWQAILEFLQRYPASDLSKLPNPFEDEGDEKNS